MHHKGQNTTRKKDDFYTEVTLLLERISNSKIKVILKMLKLVKKEFRPVISTHSLHDITNDNETKLEDLAVGNGYRIEITMFPHKDIRKSTWMAPDNTYLNQIYHVLINEKFKKYHHRCKNIKISKLRLGPLLDNQKSLN